MPIRLTRIDELILPNHRYLTRDDECYYWGEYQVHRGYSAGATNQLISNIKISPSLRNTARGYWKGHDITRAGVALRGPLRGSVTVVPIPPSKIEGDPEYDDRMLRIAQVMVQSNTSEARALVRQTSSYDASHALGTTHRITPQELLALYVIDPGQPDPHDTIIVLDDVLTQGAHFSAMKTKLLEHYPGKRIVGVFIARAVDRSAADDFDVIE